MIESQPFQGRDEAQRHLLAAALREENCSWPQEWDDEATLAQMWRQIQFHGVALALADSRDNIADWPGALMARIRDEARQQVFWEESHLAMLRRLLSALEDEGIDHRLMKGTAIAYSVYRKPAWRKRGDSDILVPESDLQRVRALLSRLGLRPRAEIHGLMAQETWLAETGFAMVHHIDLHWHPTDRPVLRKLLPVADYFADAQKLPRLAASALAADNVLCFIHGAVNQAWHKIRGYYVDGERIYGGERLIWSMDNALLAQNFTVADWERLEQIAIARGAAGLVCDALHRAERDLHAAIPAGLMARLAAQPEDAQLTRHFASHDPREAFWADLVASRGLRNKLGFLRAQILASPAHLRGKYPRAQRWPLPLLQLRRMAELAIRAARAS